jgi:hypothetical protein
MGNPNKNPGIPKQISEIPTKIREIQKLNYGNQIKQ